MNVASPQLKGGLILPGMKRKEKHADTQSHYSHRLPLLNWLPPGTRNHFVAMAGEFVGTFLFLFFAFAATQVANTVDPNAAATTGADTSRLLYISLAFGFSLAVNAWVFFRISGGLFNPAVTLGMCLVGAVPYIRGGLVVVAQLVGAIAASAVVDGLFPGGLNVRTSLGAGTTVVQGLFIEMFLTAELVFTIFMLAAEKHKATFIAPVGIGLSLFVAELCGVFFTGGSVNPARSFGPCVVLHSFYTYHWIYWVGPILGSLVASGFYKFIKALEYETVNPGQDLDDIEANAFDPEKDVARPIVGVDSTTGSVVLARQERQDAANTVSNNDPHHLANGPQTPMSTLSSMFSPTGAPTQPTALGSTVPMEASKAGPPSRRPPPDFASNTRHPIMDGPAPWSLIGGGTTHSGTDTNGNYQMGGETYRHDTSRDSGLATH